MKKISVVIPVYNEESNLLSFFEALIKIDYPPDKFECVFVNDSSRDKSLSIIKSFMKNNSINAKIINQKKNEGRSYTINNGIQNSSFKYILILGVRCLPDRQLLNKFNILYNGYPILSDVFQTKKGLFPGFMYVIRSLIYDPYYMKEFKDFYLTKDNFNKIVKGTGGLFIEKELAIDARISNYTDLNSSDDTAFLWNVVQRKNILKSYQPRIYYVQRTDLFDNLKHIFYRGPKFVDYYIRPKTRFFFLIPISVLFIFFIIFLPYLSFIYLEPVIYFAGFIVLFSTIFLLLKKFTIISILKFLLVAPIMFSAFGFGIVFGLILRIKNILNNRFQSKPD